MNEFVTMTEIGKLFGVTSHKVGNWLVDVGLRTSQKKPSKKAFDRGYVKQAPSRQEDTYFYVWHRQKTVFALEAVGHVQVAHQPPGRLVGPFESRQSGTNGFEIVGSDGTTAVWVIGDENATDVVRLMNVAFDNGMFGGIKKNARLSG